MCPIANITIDGEQRLWRNRIAQRHDVIDQLIVRRHLTHLLLGAQVDSQIDDILLEQRREPRSPLIHSAVAKASLDADWQASCLGRGNSSYGNVWIAN